MHKSPTQVSRRIRRIWESPSNVLAGRGCTHCAGQEASDDLPSCFRSFDVWCPRCSTGCAAIATQQSGSTNDWTMRQMQQAAQMANDQAVQNANNVNNAMLIQQQALLSLMPIQMATP